MNEDRGIKNLIFVDCEASGKCPSMGKLTEFGAVAYPSKASFHGILVERKPSEENSKPKEATGRTFDEGLVGNFMDTQSWKKLRVTKHDHNPVHDAMGNVEVFERLLNGER